MSFLVLEGVTKRHGAVVALDGVSLGVAEGSRTAIVGPSGSGKTSLLRVVAGFEAADAGRVVLGGEVVADGPSGRPAHRRGVGVVSQDGALFPHLDIGQNVAFGLGRGERGGRQVAELLRMVGLDAAMAERRPDQLSGGQQQRVALARALARRPRLMLLDEPFSALDTGLRASTRHAVTQLLAAAGITTVLVTHDQAEALSFADQVAVLRQGRLVQTGTPRDLYFRPADAGVAAFMGEAIILPAVLGGGTAACALGRLPVGPGEAGAGQVMLRPEQVMLEAAADGPGRVAAVEFAGAASLVTVELAGGESLVLRQPSDRVFAPGMAVRLLVTGSAHVLGAGRGSADAAHHGDVEVSDLLA